MSSSQLNATERPLKHDRSAKNRGNNYFLISLSHKMHLKLKSRLNAMFLI